MSLHAFSRWTATSHSIPCPSLLVSSTQVLLYEVATFGCLSPRVSSDGQRLSSGLAVVSLFLHLPICCMNPRLLLQASPFDGQDFIVFQCLASLLLHCMIATFGSLDGQRLCSIPVPCRCLLVNSNNLPCGCMVASSGLSPRSLSRWTATSHGIPVP